MTSMRKSPHVALALTLAVCMALAACGGGDDDDSSAQKTDSAAEGTPAASPDIKGQKITVLMPYKVPQKLLDEFTAESGVEVQYDVAGWDAVASKLTVAHQAGTYIADVTEFDWSFTGQYGGNGWYEPLQDRLDKSVIDDLSTTNGSFTTDGNLYAACYSNDFKLPLYNEKMFKAAGLDGFPATFDELRSDLDTLKAKGVAEAPMAIPMGATEGSVTPWYLLTLAMGGQLFDDDYKPLFNDPDSPAFKALQFEIDAVKNGWVSPGSVTQDDGQALERFTGGGASTLLAGGPGNLSAADDKAQSDIVGQARAGLVPGVDGPGATFGLQEGLGIPVTAKAKDAAAAFIDWWQRPETQVKMYKAEGFLPCGKQALDQLAADKQLAGGDVVSQQFDHIQPLFPQGAPTWYSQFSSEAQGLLNAAFKGDMTAQEALDQLADRANEIAQSAG